LDNATLTTIHDKTASLLKQLSLLQTEDDTEAQYWEAYYTEVYKVLDYNRIPNYGCTEYMTVHYSRNFTVLTCAIR